MPIHGSIEEAGLPDVLQLLALGRKSGCLSVVDGELRGEVYLDVGRISFASVANRDRLGEMLVKSGRITREQLSRATAEQQGRSSNRPLGKILLASGYVDRAALEQAVRRQVEDAVYVLFTWKQGTFTFASDQKPARGALLVSLDAESLLLEGARRVDEWSLIQKKIPSFDLVYQRTAVRPGGKGSDDLTDDQRAILPLLDGTQDVAAIADATGMDEFDVGKALYGLIVAGLARLVERRTRVRHLDYRELLAYVVREAEFADAERRKLVARHIVDCPSCSERLRTIHVRRTAGHEAITEPVPAVTAAAAAAAATAAPAAPAAAAAAAAIAARTAGAPATRTAAPTAAPAPPAARERPPAAYAAAPVKAPSPPDEQSERRALERRTARDRRRQERRAARDRRSADRRAGLDRRRTVNAEWTRPERERRQHPRRASDRGASRGRDRRSGESDRRADTPVMAAPDVALHSPAGRATIPRMPAVERRGAPPPAPHPESSLPAVASAAPAEPATTTPSPAPHQSPPVPEPGRPSKELVWLMSPQESQEFHRASWAQSRAADTPAPPAARITAATAPMHQVEPIRRSPVVTRAAATQGETSTKRRFAIAAAITGVALVGYAAVQLGRSGARSGPAQEVQAAAPAGGAQALEPPPRPAQGTAPSAAAPAPPQTPLSAQQRPGPAAPARVAEQRVATNPPPTVDQPSAQRATPTSAPVPSQPNPALAAPAAQPPPPPPAPTVGIVRGAVRDAGGRPIPGARVAVRGTTLGATTDGAGAFEIRDVPNGAVVLQASADRFVAGTAEVQARAGLAVSADLTLAPVPVVAATPPPALPPAAAPAAAPTPTVAAAEPDRDLAAGGWAPVDRAEAATILGGGIGAIQGLSIESIARSTAGTRPRVRLTQLTPSGERITLTQTRSGAAVRAGPAVVTAIRVMAPSEAYPFSTGTVSLGNILITAKSSIAADALRAHLERLGEIQ